MFNYWQQLGENIPLGKYVLSTIAKPKQAMSCKKDVFFKN
jgi:hypothetical protein